MLMFGGFYTSLLLAGLDYLIIYSVGFRHIDIPEFQDFFTILEKNLLKVFATSVLLWTLYYRC